MPSRSSSREPTYARLEPHTTHISSSKILKKWKFLPPPSQDRVKALLLALKAESHSSHRNANIKSTSKKLDLSDAEHEAVVNDLVSRLCTRIPRMPFPPTRGAASEKASEIDFDFEATLDRISKLEAELNMNVESAKVLREQVKIEEAMLRRDREEYKQLEDGVRSERALARRQEGRLHAIARDVEIDADGETDNFESRDLDQNRLRWQTRSRTKKPALTNEEVGGDEKLAPLVKQLRSHLSSMSTNTAGMTPVRDALEDAEGALSAFAWKGLNREGYEKVVGLRS